MEKKHRNVQEISQEYTQVCAKAGHIQYQISVLEKDLDMVNQALLDLNNEAAASKAAESATAEGSTSAASPAEAPGAPTALADM